METIKIQSSQNGRTEPVTFKAKGKSSMNSSIIRSIQEISNVLFEKKEQQASKKRVPGNSDAAFLGWQRISSGNAIALYNVMVKNHPLYQSTVTAGTLRELNLKIPPTPSMHEPIENIYRK
jgi:hypothetical protein